MAKTLCITQTEEIKRETVRLADKPVVEMMGMENITYPSKGKKKGRGNRMIPLVQDRFLLFLTRTPTARAVVAMRKPNPGAPRDESSKPLSESSPPSPAGGPQA